MIKLFEKFTESNEAKDIIFVYAVQTYKPEVIEFFLNKGYNIDTDDALDSACSDLPTLKFMLEKGADVENISDRKLRDLDIQKVLIDYGHERYIHETVGFNYALRNDSDYVDVIKRIEDMEKYNL